MSETTLLRDLLLPELETEIGKTRRLFEALPDGEVDFQPYGKSMPLGRLAGHTTDLFRMIALILTSSDFDMAIAWKPYTMESKAQLLAQYEENAEKALRALKQTSDETFHQQWRILRGPLTLFSGERYTAYRSNGINQIIHHRAQLGTYIRAMSLPLPGMYGASADGI